ncbi:hypothetical protein [Butyrivibrio sp. XPD2002]|uniref:hypothetical protein n=1 Tax=Butyrivibrio sp. XPD2002 TaxID=1280665 RepID=UPI0004063EBC|nr:hypothetical protein [Butyrivibrio sp. XPD2002]
MDFNAILEQSGISLLLFVICAYYAFRLLVFKDYTAVRGKQEKPPKDVEGYCKAAGLVIVFFGISTLVMAGLVLISPVAGLIQIVACTAIMVIMWKKVTDKFA